MRDRLDPSFRRRVALLAALLLVGCLTAVPPSPDLASALGCRLEPRPPRAAGGPVEIRFELTNRSQVPVWVLAWNTPLEGWQGTLFSATRDGQELPYQGPMLKRGDPGREEYVEIPAGGHVEATVNLADVYEVSRPGRYRVEVVRDLLDATADAAAVPRALDRHQPVPLRCEAVVLDVPSG